MNMLKRNSHKLVALMFMITASIMAVSYCETDAVTTTTDDTVTLRVKNANTGADESISVTVSNDGEEDIVFTDIPSQNQVGKKVVTWSKLTGFEIECLPEELCGTIDASKLEIKEAASTVWTIAAGTNADGTSTDNPATDGSGGDGGGSDW